MIRPLILATSAALLSACNPPAPALTPTPDPCISAGAAKLEPPPARPALTPEQQEALDVATIVTLGADLGLALIRYHDAELPAYVGRLTTRIEQNRDWCLARE